MYHLRDVPFMPHPAAQTRAWTSTPIFTALTATRPETAAPLCSVLNRKQVLQPGQSVACSCARYTNQRLSEFLSVRPSRYKGCAMRSRPCCLILCTLSSSASTHTLSKLPFRHLHSFNMRFSITAISLLAAVGSAAPLDKRKLFFAEPSM